MSDAPPHRHARAVSLLDSRPQWIELFHAGDRRTIEKCYREYKALVRRTIGARASTSFDPDNICHEVFLRLLRSSKIRRSFTGGNFAGWIVRVAQNLAIDHVRREERERLRDWHRVDASAGGLESDVASRQIVDRLRAAVPEQCKALFDARFLGGLSQYEAARALGLTRGIVAHRERVMREALKAFAEKANEEGFQGL